MDAYLAGTKITDTAVSDMKSQLAPLYRHHPSRSPAAREGEVLMTAVLIPNAVALPLPLAGEGRGEGP